MEEGNALAKLETCVPSPDETWRQLYKNRSSRKRDSQRLSSREYDFLKTFSLTENLFSGKTYFYSSRPCRLEPVTPFDLTTAARPFPLQRRSQPDVDHEGAGGTPHLHRSLFRGLQHTSICGFRTCTIQIRVGFEIKVKCSSLIVGQHSSL